MSECNEVKYYSPVKEVAIREHLKKKKAIKLIEIKAKEAKKI
jgi:hypothetical protein